MKAYVSDILLSRNSTLSILANYFTFCGNVCTKEDRKIQERALQFLYDDQTETCECLLENSNISTLYLRWIKVIASDLFKSLEKLNQKFMNEIFKIKDISYDLIDSNIIFQPIFSKITYGPKSFN